MDTVDFHAHVIPKADHGSSSVEVALEQLRLAKRSDVNRIIATPHFYPHRENPSDFLARRNYCYNKLQSHLTSELPDIRLGAEVLICDNIEEMPMLDELCIEGTKILLLELPFTDFSDSFVTSVKYLVNRGYTVVLAHVDRYDPSHINRLLNVGAYAQVNADALTRIFVSQHVKKWLTEKKVFAIGSDIHGVDKKYYAHFKRALKRFQRYSSDINGFSDTAWCEKK